MMLEPSKLWAATTLFDIATPKQWKTIAKKDLLTQGFPVYGANGPIGYFNEYSHEHATLMITCRGASCGNIHLSVPKSYINGNAMTLDNLSSNVNLKYLYYFLKSSNFNDIISGSAQPQITQDGLKKLKIRLAPFNEQKRIADKLDSLLEKVNTAQKRLDKIPGVLKRFRQSVLESLTSGELSKNSEIESWDSSILKNICKSISDGDHQAPPKAESGIPFLVISNINTGKVNFEKVSRWVPKDYYDNLKDIRKPTKDDILYTVTGSFGIPVVVDSKDKFCFQRHIAIIKPDHEQINSQFLAYYLSSPLIYNHANAVATGTAQRTVSLTNLRKFEIKFPNLTEQQEIVRQVDSLFALADSVEKQYHHAKKHLDKLTQSILAKAFRGELVSQDPNDEPASVLLEKIQQEKAEQAKIRKTAKKSPHKKAPRKKAPQASAKSEDNKLQVEFKLTPKAVEAASIPENYLFLLLSSQGGKLHANALWDDSNLSIDDFYTQLKTEIAAGLIVENKTSPDPELRTLSVNSTSGKALSIDTGTAE